VKIYRVYTHPTFGAEAVKVGFSWPAAFLIVIWMLAKKLWKLSAIWILAYIVLTVVQDAAVKANSLAGILMVLAVHMALALIPAFQGNEWRAKDLSKRGFELVDSVPAKTPDAAIAQVLERPGV